ncbi:MAG: YggS family pyridoxal phosphate-dependent enzyme [bacterium]|nr:YggS family pyridoxal phosphate-dependent enzyme [bacterium]MCP4965093.1 YggS family pyridoxal phosphate-dependent enzyme [bacterium]
MVAKRLSEIRERVSAAAGRVGRRPSEVTLVAVSKGHPADAILEAYDAGQRDFGENRAAELAAKAPGLPQDIRWHFIGSLQTRQAKIARPHTHLLHSLDRVRLANSWVTEEGAPPVLLQVNVAGETQKHGAEPAQVEELLAHADEIGLACRGLMVIPPFAATPEDSRKWFAILSEIRDGLLATHPHLTDLSMGMTDDFEVAIEEGATIIRVGRAIFEASGDPTTID